MLEDHPLELLGKSVTSNEFEREKWFLNARFVKPLTFIFLSYSSFCCAYKQVSGSFQG